MSEYSIENFTLGTYRRNIISVIKNFKRNKCRISDSGIQCGMQEKMSVGFKVMTGLLGRPGAEPPGRRIIFENLKKFLQKMAKMHYFLLFCKNISKHCVKFPALARKTLLVREILRKS